MKQAVENVAAEVPTRYEGNCSLWPRPASATLESEDSLPCPQPGLPVGGADSAPQLPGRQRHLIGLC